MIIEGVLKHQICKDVLVSGQHGDPKMVMLEEEKCFVKIKNTIFPLFIVPGIKFTGAPDEVQLTCSLTQ
ncbi:hypothetical protein HZH66_014806 [Vespula vulgaris]|uniref:Uncharacterized protein n=1 Tax=Vespula vulgaris TaxID=7454 RepID=A0A834J065_VESVU|nr:hypothetical protein HZH66_014806 [Vespula vulgaris]